MLPIVPLLLLLQADPSASLTKWIDDAGQAQLAKREAAIAAIKTPEQIRERQKYTRAMVLELIGGLPDYQGPLNGRVMGTIDAGGYRIEKVLFESFPKYYVTANLYVPKSGGKHPGVLFPLGHWDQGKPAAQVLAGNLALKGFVVLAYDPVGQGERLQAYDKRWGASLANGSTEQHTLAGGQALLIGESFAKYHVWDARRALDYLVSRPEVDAARIGATGCSGGGTITTYISALDDRIKVSAPACYTNSWHMLLAGPTGDAEQTFPRFLASGLDMADYPEMFAPKPWLMSSTQDDFFTPAGARIVYDEAQKWYTQMGAGERVKWVVGPGGHGTPLLVREAIYDWMIRWLADGKGSAKEQDITVRPDHEFQVTKSGQVSTEFADAKETWQFIRESYERRKHAGDIAAFVRGAVKAVDDRMAVEMKVVMPGGMSAKAPAVLLVGDGAVLRERAAEASKAGEIVVWVYPRGTPVKGTPNLTGDWITNARALVVGQVLPAMRAHDILAAVDAVESKASKVSVVATDVAGVWALYAAAADPRISKLEVIRTPWSFRAALDGPLTRGLYEGLIPGMLLEGDLPELTKAIGADRVVWRDPVDWMRRPVVVAGAVYTAFGH